VSPQSIEHDPLAVGRDVEVLNHGADMLGVNLWHRHQEKRGTVARLIGGAGRVGAPGRSDRLSDHCCDQRIQGLDFLLRDDDESGRWIGQIGKRD
jgi:hypothetical protein